MTKARPLPLPPSGISVWKPLSSSEGGLVAILGSGPNKGEHASGEDVQCVWCGLRSRPAAACEVCGSPLYESICIWQPNASTQVDPPPRAVRSQPVAPVTAPPKPGTRPQRTRFGWSARTKQLAPSTRVPEVRGEPSTAEPTNTPPAPPPDTAFKAFRRFAGLDIRWVRRPGE